MKTIVKIFSLAFALSLAGCSSAPWTAKVFTDEFSDNSFCRVAERHSAIESAKEGALAGLGVGRVSHEFFAEMRNDGPRVGVWARLGFFSGDVQIRVDKHPFVLVTARDTPIDVGASQIQAPAIKLPNATEEQQKAYEESLQAATQNVAALSSPYRVATGKKAKKLIGQIRGGKQIKFRVLGVNKATTTTATIEITEQFKSALQKCKIL
ncbi:MAG: hypothetical protein MPK31_02185 [Gammaproteobacteria bacterium]|nr:hypothetical protein [Gammaproteobacteria bacterium]